MTKRLFLWSLVVVPFVLWGGFDVTFTPDGPVTTKTVGPDRSVPPVEGMVAVPLTDLRRTPDPVPPQAVFKKPYGVDPHQESQLLFGERVLIFEAKGPWLRVEAPDQAEFTHAGRWQGYPGWVSKEAVIPRPSNFFPAAVVVSRYARVRQTKKVSSSFMELPMGARVGVIYTEKGWVRVQGPQGEMGWMRARDVRLDREAPQKGPEVRQAILAAVRQFLGEPYYWGGRSGHKKKGEFPTGIDCSAIVNLGYRAVSLNAPRDSHEQFLIAHPLEKGTDLQPGDLVFLAKKTDPDQIVHVMIYEKNETLIEASPQLNKVRRVSFKKKLGVSQSDLRSGSMTSNFIVRLGTFLDQ